MALTLKRIAIKNPESTDIVTLSNIIEGVDGAAAFGWTQEGSEVRVEDNQTMEHSHLGDLDIKVLTPNEADLTIINNLIASPVEISGWTINGFFRMRNNPLLNRSQDFSSAILNDHIYLTTNAPKGYSNEGADGWQSAAFYAGANALRLYNTDTGDDDLISGFEADAGVTASRSGAMQTVTTDTEGDGVSSLPIFFPFPAARLIAAADFSAADERFNIGVRFLNASGATISESVNDFIASGRRSHAVTLPANTAYVQFITTRNADTGASGSWTFTRPSLRTDSPQYSN
jgi:hypothetical protein